MTVRPAILVSVVATSLAVAALCVPAGGMTSRGPCYPEGSKGLARDSSGRVYYDTHREHYYGCLFSRGKAVPLDGDDTVGDPERFESRANGGESAPVAIAGRFVGFVGERCGDQCRTGLYVYDLLNRRVRHEFISTGRSRCVQFSGGEECYEDQLTGLVLKRNGSIAWLACLRLEPNTCNPYEHPRYQVKRLDSRGTKLLDASDDIDRRSLRLTQSRKGVTWIKGGKRYGVSLR
jgi:hypothetical protein